MIKDGVLTGEQIIKLTNLKRLNAQGDSVGFSPSHVQPASIDLTLSEEAYITTCAALPGKEKIVDEMITDIAVNYTPIKNGPLYLKPGMTAIVRLNEAITDPVEGIRYRANPKSSTGRLDIFVRLIGDYSQRYDEITDDYSGPLYAEISPLSFPIEIYPNDTLLQLRAIKGNPKPLYEKLCYLNLTDYQDAAGYVAKKEIIDNDGGVTTIQMNHRKLNPLDYFYPVPNKDSLIVLPNRFYILATLDDIKIPENQAAEMLPFEAEIGEYRVHYAGFFDPGFGMNGHDSKGVLELRGRDVPFRLTHGQPIAKLAFYPMSETPKESYGVSGSNYQGQGLRLAKQFNTP